MNIRDLMTSDVQTVAPTDTAQAAAGFMLSADTGSIPVCDGDKIVGMITDRDIAVRGVGKGLGPDCTVAELMSKDIVCARDTDDVHAIAQQMSDKQVRRMPVIDAEDRLVGIVSLGDLSRQAQDSAAKTALDGVSAEGSQHEQH
ncbi:MAG: CBS domain-containing protein [Sphingomonas bacterium]|nr:CBS domain-containing protein [Sphingomonas bacterium]